MIDGAAGSARLRREVGCSLGFEFHEPSLMAVQVAAARSGTGAEQLLASRGPGGEPITPLEVAGAFGGRVHLIEAPAGPVSVSYTASTAPEPVVPPDRFDDEVLAALRQSRYCPSDLMGALAAIEFHDIDRGDPAAVAAAAASWVFERTAYIPGSTGPADTAVDTLLSGRGVCRDFAHLTIAMCRARGVPARLVAVYAPGLSPMDFHAVAEVWVGHRWEVVDATRLAPRAALVRVATGRDAADTALTATVRGDVELVTSEVFAVVEGDLPPDDHRSPVVLA